MSTKPSGGRGARFAGAMDPAAAALNASIDFDRRLLRDDVRGSQAHRAHPCSPAVGLISAADAEAIRVKALDQVAGEFERGERKLDGALEDVHMNVESRLIELVGELARRLHTARGAATTARSPRICCSTRGGPRRSISSRPSIARASRARAARASDGGHVLPGYDAPAAYGALEVVTLGVTCSPTPRCCAATAGACSTRPSARRAVAARVGRARGDELAHRSRPHVEVPRVRRAHAQQPRRRY